LLSRPDSFFSLVHFGLFPSGAHLSPAGAMPSLFLIKEHIMPTYETVRILINCFMDSITLMSDVSGLQSFLDCCKYLRSANMA
jgi:hypothetical protein